MANDISSRDQVTSVWSALLGVPSDQACRYAPRTRIVKMTLSGADFLAGTLTATTAKVKLKNPDGSLAQIPVGARATQSEISCHVAFSGDTTATVQIGDGTTVDRYNTGTPSIFTVGEKDAGAVSGTAFHAAAENITVTLTSSSAIGSINPLGLATFTIEYKSPVA